MRLLLTGACGFVGSALCEAIAAGGLDWQVVGLDNLGRPGSELNRRRLAQFGVHLVHGDLRCQSDVDALPAVEWIVDCAANPSVVAGANGHTSSRQLMEHNLVGTLHMLEKCRRDKSGFVLLSTSRVYSIDPLVKLPVDPLPSGYQLQPSGALPPGVSPHGIDETFTTAAPISLYGASKLASEALVAEYGAAFDFPFWINRCGVLAGPGQFGRADQGIFAYWINSHLRRQPLRYIGFGGEGKQVRDCLHPRDLLALLQKQLCAVCDDSKPRLVNVSGGMKSACSLRQLTEWCDARFGTHSVTSDLNVRRFDVPWLVLDSRRAETAWNWTPQTPCDRILEEIAEHAEANPQWLNISASA